MAKKEIICAGFGGQGVLTAGMLLINAGMEQDKNVLFYPHSILNWECCL